MSCDVGKATEGLENELWRRWSDGKVGEWGMPIVSEEDLVARILVVSINYNINMEYFNVWETHYHVVVCHELKQEAARLNNICKQNITKTILNGHHTLNLCVRRWLLT